jgi:hypothetical protein
MLGVEALVVGSVSDLGNQVDVDLRVIEIETNRMMFGASATITKDQVVDNLLKSGREEVARSAPAISSRSGGSSSSGVTSGIRIMRIPNATLEIVDIRRSGPQVIFAVLVTNLAEKESEFCISHLGPQYSYFVDSFGNRHTKGKVSPGACFSAEPNVPQRVLYAFDDVPAESSSGTLTIFNDSYRPASPRARATERNIPLPR